MYETTIKVEGMMCSMCEAHINDAVRAATATKKVSSSRKKGETVILTEKEPDLDAIKSAIAATGYTVGEASVKPYSKGGLFKGGLFSKRG